MKASRSDLGRLCMLVGAVLGALVYIAHPVVHPGLDVGHATHSQSQVPDQCTLCQTQHDTTPADPIAALLEPVGHPAPAPLLYADPFPQEDVALSSLAPRAPPSLLLS